MGHGSGIQFRLVLTLGVIAVVAIAGILAIVPYRLYERDIRHATVEAHRVSGVVQAALSGQLADGKDTSDLVNRIQSVGDMKIALARLEAGEVRTGAVAGRGSSVLDDTDLRYVSTPVLDDEGRAWVAEMQFDLSSMKRESMRLIQDLVIAVAVGATLFSVVIFMLFRRALVLPLRELAKRVERIASGDAEVAMPAFESREMTELADAIQRLAARG
ncbi:MAG: HAMP domain-containing protein [Myxococcota bacterium]|nr:HAMP domain-containing protein [Myxococcota bacterium]